MIPVGKAFKIIDENIEPLGSERVPLGECVGRVLAENIVADSDMPPFDRAQMDGYAVRSRDTRHVPVNLTIVGESAAGSPSTWRTKTTGPTWRVSPGLS